jgi:hypothetical protein
MNLESREGKLALLLARLACYSDEGLDGFLAMERETCPFCGVRARRVKTMPRARLVVLACRQPGCPWRATRDDGTRAHKIRVRKSTAHASPQRIACKNSCD